MVYIFSNHSSYIVLKNEKLKEKIHICFLHIFLLFTYFVSALSYYLFQKTHNQVNVSEGIAYGLKTLLTVYCEKTEWLWWRFIQFFAEVVK